jgi:hypothetical protein
MGKHSIHAGIGERERRVVHQPWHRAVSLLKAIGSKYETVFVTAAGNDNDIVRDFPALYAMDTNLLVVGGSTKDGT